MIKLPFDEYKKIKRMSQKEMTLWVQALYKSAYNDGYEARKADENNGMDWDKVKIAISAVKGVGEKKKAEIVKTVERLCFGGDKE